MKVSVVLAIGFVLLIALARVPAAAAADGPAEPDSAREIFNLLNQERTKAGLPALAWDDGLAAAAVAHAQLMAEKKKLSHDFPGEPPLRQRLSAVPLDRSGENVGFDSSVSGAHEGFMASPPHRANILNRDYDAVGIGVVRSGEYVWVAEDFAHRMVTMGSTEVESTVARLVADARKRAGSAMLRNVNDSHVRRVACEMARHDDPDSALGLALPGARFAIAYTATDVHKLPSNAQRLIDLRDASYYAVGACFERTPKYPSGVYWVMIVAFAR